MRIQRIITEFNSSDLDATRDFYCGLLGLSVDMQEGTFLMLSAEPAPVAQVIVNDNGHPGLPPGFAIDVSDADAVKTLYDEVLRRSLPIVEPLSDKPWGIRRFSVIDPNGVRVTIISHIDTDGG